ncbi:MAG TPA: 2Fe-2S iron-sulfur cluster-binding protein [Flavobacteriales bacterium]|nr:2Fe-2S iron-sulfur cluster-binding protein [Flavobacteriales bacterium]HPH82168.1 2Fe-2S iron-sulfur cluster-binding protein [Flavobacteriales bacterium]
MAKFFPLLISDIYKDTDECSVITLEVPEQLKREFQYKQGQHLTLRAMIGNQDVRRSYSLCSSPLERKWQVAVKKIDGGLFSTYANETLKKGDTIEVMPPHGTFYKDCTPSQKKNYIAFAAGSGITPILSIIKTHLASEPESTFKLFYLNRNVKSILFKEDIEALKNEYFNRFEIFYFLTKEHRDVPLMNGRFTSDKINTLTNKIFDPKSIDECFICGPESMIFLIRDELETAGIAKEKIHYELFTAGNSTEQQTHVKSVLDKKVEGTEVTIIDGGKEFHFTMSKQFDNILDGALAAGADLPFACKGGVCSTCRCKVLEGEAEMKVNYALDESELKRNFILSCQAVPTTSRLVVDFDV